MFAVFAAGKEPLISSGSGVRSDVMAPLATKQRIECIETSFGKNDRPPKKSVVAARILALPVPGIAAHVFDVAGGAPV